MQAVGHFFWEYLADDDPNADKYRKDIQNRAIFDIPIKQRALLAWYGNEVRFVPKDINSAITPDMWTGIVIDEEDLSLLEKLTEGLSAIPNIPIFSTGCSFLSIKNDTDLRTHRKLVM